MCKNQLLIDLLYKTYSLYQIGKSLILIETAVDLKAQAVLITIISLIVRESRGCYR